MRVHCSRRRLLAALGGLALLASCGRATDRASRSSGAPALEPRAPTPAATLAPDGLRATSVYFADREGRRLIPVTRYLVPDSGLARGAVQALLGGPVAEDPAAVSSAVPAGTRLLGITVSDSIVTVDLSRAFESGAGSATVRLRLAQLTFTLTRLAGVRGARLRIEGRPASVFSMEGLDVSQGLRRKDFRDLAPFDDDPPVVLWAPVPGSTTRGPILARGSANVFEANVGLRVREPSGRIVVSAWTTATCGTGCRGTFEKTLALPDSARGDLVVEAFEPSAKDGSDLHLVRSRIHRAP